MKSRLKKTAPVIPNRVTAEAVAREITTQILKERELKTRMDTAITKVRKDFEETIADATKGLAERVAMLEDWASANPAEFAGKKSLDLLHAVIGWRTGQPQAKTVTGWTWGRVLEAVKASKLAALFIRTKEELNKEQIIVERGNIPAEELRGLGIRVVQEEAFFVEPKVEDLEAGKGVS